MSGSTNGHVSTAARRIMALLVGRPPQSMAQLVTASGVTRTAVAEQLGQLVDAGYVQRDAECVGRGRPKYLFSATNQALSQLYPNHQGLFGQALLIALRSVGGEDLFRRVMEATRERLVHHFAERLPEGDIATRVDQMIDLLRDEGILIDVEKDGQDWRIYQRTCPMIDLVDDTRAACRVEREMMTAVLGVPISLTECRLDGCAAGCTFQVTVPDAAGQADSRSRKAAPTRD